MKIRYILSIAMIGVFGFSLVSLATYADPTGEVKGRVKLYENGNSTGEKVNDAKVRLYKKNGKKVDSDKTSSNGKYKFKDVKTGEYYISCKADGFVNAKKSEKEKYKTGTFKVKEDKTTKKNCRLALSADTIEKLDNGKSIDYSERPKGTSKREWRAIMGF